jgi:5'-3' exonuclease
MGKGEGAGEGIKGLTKIAIKPECQDVHMSAFADQWVAVDTAGWMYDAVKSYKAAQMICLKEPDGVMLAFNDVIAKVQSLVRHKVKPVLVIDGGAYPPKRNTQIERRIKDQQLIDEGVDAMVRKEAGNAAKRFKEAARPTPELVAMLIAHIQL